MTTGEGQFSGVPNWGALGFELRWGRAGSTDWFRSLAAADKLRGDKYFIELKQNKSNSHFEAVSNGLY